MTKIFKNNEIVEMTAEEQTIFDESKVAIQAEETRVNNKIQAEKTAQASGNQKLLDLGLTQAEATALTGYTPPVAE